MSFPDDDVGYGFDNIGDVLAISPLRMEQYLNAAERLTACLLGKSDGFELDATTEAVFFERTKKARNNSDRGLEMVPESELYLDFEFPAPGEYEMRIYAWGVESPSEKDKEKNERWLEKDGTIVRDPNAKAGNRCRVTMRRRSDWSGGRLRGKRHNGAQDGLLRSISSSGGNTHAPDSTSFSGAPVERTDQGALEEAPICAATRDAAHRHPWPLLVWGGSYQPSEPNRKASYNPVPLRLAETHRLLLDVRPVDSAGIREASEKILAPVASRAFRRPITESELGALCDYVQTQVSQGIEFDDAIELAVQAILVSPRFLFRLELGPPQNDSGIIAPVDDYALASRLSYFLWASMPDDELFELAAEQKLSEDDVLSAQVERMLGDPPQRCTG